MTDKNELKLFQRLSNQYTDLNMVRALIQAIPYAGGSLDTLLGSSGQRFKEQRIENLILHLTNEIKKIGSNPSLDNIPNNEELYDMMLLALEQSSRTKRGSVLQKL